MRLDVQQAGKRGPRVVLVHGLGVSNKWWSGQVPYLSTFCRVIAPTLRGHGKSPHGKSYEIASIAEDIAQLSDDLFPDEQYVIVGGSLGAWVAAEVASLRPQSVRGLVIAGARAKADARRRKIMELAITHIQAGEFEQFSETMTKLVWSPAWHVDVPALVESYKAVILGNDPEVYTAYMKILAKYDPIPTLQKLRCPIRAIIGAVDQLAEFDDQVAIRRALPKATFRIMPGIGHDAPMEAPHIFNALIMEFLLDLEKPDPG